MKINFIIFLWATFLITFASTQCFYHPNNIFSSLEYVECNWNSGDNLVQHRRSSEGMIKIQLNCKINDKVICDKVLKEFNRAANLISSTFIFNTQIIVNLSFYDFCTVYPDNICRDLLGAAYPSQFYALQDDDGVNRLYPQSLVKQFRFPNAPLYNQYDINAEFNSMAGFWYKEDLTTIKSKQDDIYWTICHELMHGLGFYNGWVDYQKIALTPMMVTKNSDGSVPKKNLNAMESPFVEFMMDKYTILLSNGTQISKYTQQLNTFFTEYNTNVINDKFYSSSQFKFAQDLLTLATTPKSLGLLPRNSKNFATDSIILETSLSPYEQGTSLVHVDYNTYIRTSDFLMTYKSIDGATTDQMILNTGKYPGGPIGPKLKLLMETFGYTTTDNPNPYRPQPFTSSSPPPPAATISKSSSFKLSITRNINIPIIFISSIFASII